MLFWGFVGYYVSFQWGGVLAIFIIGCIITGKTKGYLFPPRTFLSQILGGVYTILTLAMMIAWLYISAPPDELKIYPADYAHYMNHLGQRFKQNIILPLISITWLARVFKLIGWTVLSSLVELVPKIFKKKE